MVDRKFNLAEMLVEIKQDEEVAKNRSDYWASQDEIKQLLLENKKSDHKSK